MSLSTFLLVILVSCVAAVQINDQRNQQYTNYRRSIDHIETLATQAKYPRQKRALSPFAQAWKALLKTTIGYRRMPVLGNDRKFFAKIGSQEQAGKDFLSLRPKEVVRKGYGFKGHVGNEVIELHMRAPDGSKIPRAILYVVDREDAKVAYGVHSSSKTTREIYYFEKPEDVKNLWLGFFPWKQMR